jgi:cell fate regulator YaaT (PSP1 superfamily)
MPTTVEVRFKGNRKDYFHWPDESDRLGLHQPVIVEAERGLDFGRVGVSGEVAAKKCAAGCGGCAVGGGPPAPSKNVVRRASQEDIRTANDLRRSEEETRARAVERVRHHAIEMKLSDAEWQWDRKKLTLYFTAEKRVDFRDLVRDLASTFKTRIELRQIGVRDEAARLGGVGRCGKEYCCSSWLRELDPVSLSLAKDQHLSLNPSQISGGCGRLLCCLKYEHEFYVTSRKRFPKEGKTLRTSVGAEKVIAVDIFRERVFLRSDERGSRIVLLADLKDELERIGETLPAAAKPREGTTRAARPPRSSPPGAAVAPAVPTTPTAPAIGAAAVAPSPSPSPSPSAPPPVPADPSTREPAAGPVTGGAPVEGAAGNRRRRRRRRGRRPGPPGGPPSAPPEPG